MSSNSPLNPKEHSICQTFKKSRWVYSKYLIYRIPIIMIFLAWVNFACYLKALNLKSNKLITISFSLMLLNQMMIPLHTLLICGCGIDRLYLSHLLLTGIFELVFAVMFRVTWPHILIIPVVACQFMAYVYWYIPTRILYFKTFNLAKAFFKLPANTLLRKLVVPWAILCTICTCIITCIFVLACNSIYSFHHMVSLLYMTESNYLLKIFSNCLKIFLMGLMVVFWVFKTSTYHARRVE